MTWLWTQNLIVTLAYSTFFFKHVHLSSVSLEEFAAQNPTICKQTNLCRKYEFEYVVRNKTVFTKPTPDLDKIRFQFYLMPWFNWNYTDHGQFMPLLLINVMLELIPPFSKEKLYSTSFDFGFLLKNRRIPDGLEQYMYSYEHQTPYTLFECYSEINNLKGVHIWTGNFSAYNVPQAAPFIPMGTNYCSYNKAKQRMEALFMMSTEWPADFSNKDALYSYRFFNYGLVYPDPHGIDYFELIEVVANVSQFGLPEEKMEEDKERDERDVNQSLFISNKFNQTKDAEILHTYNVRKLPAPKSDDRFDVEWNYYSYSNRLLMLECIRSNETCMVATKTGLRTPNTSLCHDSKRTFVFTFDSANHFNWARSLFRRPTSMSILDDSSPDQK